MTGIPRRGTSWLSLGAPGAGADASKWRTVALVARIVAPLALLALLLWRVPPGRLLEAWSGLSPAVVLGALALIALAQILSAFKWCLLMKALGGSPTFLWSLRTYLAGMFVGTALPWAYGGDALRAYLASRYTNMTLWQGARSVLLERGSGYLALGLTALVGLASLSLPVWSTALAGVATLACLAAVRSLSGRWRRLLPLRLRETLPEAAVRALLGPALWLSTGFYLSYLGALGLLLYGLQAQIDPRLLAVAAFVSATASLLPLTIWGIGAHEASLAMMLMVGGLDQATAAAAALAFGLLFSFLGTLGGLALLPWRWPRALGPRPPRQPASTSGTCRRSPHSRLGPAGRPDLP